MANSNTNLDKTKAQMEELIDGIANSINTASIGNAIDINVLRTTKNNLNKILFKLQFEKLVATNQDQWSVVDTLDDAIDKTFDAIYEINAAILKILIIGQDHVDIITQMKNIRQNINQAVQAQQVFNFFISLVGLLRQFLVV